MHENIPYINNSSTEAKESKSRLLDSRKKLGAVILSGAVAFNVSACDNDRPADQTPVETTSVESQNATPRNDIDPAHTTPAIETESPQVSELYTPNLNILDGEDTVINVNGELIDILDFANRPSVKTESLTKMGLNRADIQYPLVAEAIFMAPFFTEGIKSTMTEEEAKGVEKQYKILDESATNQEILDNFDIEVVQITTSEQAAASASHGYTFGTLLASSDTRYGHIVNKIGDPQPILEHSMATNPDDNSSNYKIDFNGRAVGVPVGAGSDYGRHITFERSNGTLARGTFAFVEFENPQIPGSGISKWIMTNFNEYDNERQYMEAIQREEAKQGIN